MNNETREQIYSDYASGSISLNDVTNHMHKLENDAGQITPGGRFLKSILDVGVKALVPFGSYRNI